MVQVSDGRGLHWHDNREGRGMNRFEIYLGEKKSTGLLDGWDMGLRERTYIQCQLESNTIMEVNILCL